MMTAEENEVTEVTDPATDKEPIYFSPKRVNLVADLAGIFSWVVLVGFIADIVVQVINIQAQLKTGNLVLATIIREPSFLSYLFMNLAIPLLTGIGLFVLLQAAAAGLNVLLEMDYNARESSPKAGV
jgi:hypothetical protein